MHILVSNTNGGESHQVTETLSHRDTKTPRHQDTKIITPNQKSLVISLLTLVIFWAFGYRRRAFRYIFAPLHSRLAYSKYELGTSTSSATSSPSPNLVPVYAPQRMPLQSLTHWELKTENGKLKNENYFPFSTFNFQFHKACLTPNLSRPFRTQCCPNFQLSTQKNLLSFVFRLLSFYYICKFNRI